MRTESTRRAVAAGTLLAACLAPHAARAETWTIVPSVAVTETYSDNLALVDQERAVRGWITDISPALRIDLAGARSKGFLDLRLHDLTYSGEPELDETQKFLYSRLTLEAVEKWLFVDARAETTQQNRSPFGAAVSPDQPTPNRNRIETSTLQLAPFVRGRLAEAADYLVRYNAADVRTDEDGVPDTRTGEFSARLQSASPAARIGWALRDRAFDHRCCPPLRSFVLHGPPRQQDSAQRSIHGCAAVARGAGA